MMNPIRTAALLLATLAFICSPCVQAQDWPQWRGADRDAKVSGFDAPKVWPTQLNQKWKVAVGEGVATPALVGDKLFVFSREGNDEVTRCLDAASGKELWQDKYDSQGATGPAASFSGPRSSPAVADGKVVTMGVRGTLSCLDAASGKKLWRKNDFPGEWPNFFVSSSPLILNGLCIAQAGGRGSGAIVAYDLTSGEQKWKWTGDGPGYASPAVMTVGDSKLIIALTEKSVVAINSADGKLAWEAPFAAQGMGAYNAASPVVDGQTLIYSGGGRGTRAVKIEKGADGFTAKELWTNPDMSVQFSTPVLKDGLLYGLTQGNELFCLSAETGKTAWTAPIGQPARNPAPGGGPPRRGRGGYGSIVDAGSVLLSLTPGEQLIAFAPTDKAYAEKAKIKVAESPTYAYPIVSGNRVIIKDQESVTLSTIE